MVRDILFFFFLPHFWSLIYVFVCSSCSAVCVYVLGFCLLLHEHLKYDHTLWYVLALRRLLFVNKHFCAPQNALVFRFRSPFHSHLFISLPASMYDMHSFSCYSHHRLYATVHTSPRSSFLLISQHLPVLFSRRCRRHNFCVSIGLTLPLMRFHK